MCQEFCPQGRGGIRGRGHAWWEASVVGGHVARGRAWQERRLLQRTECILLECILVCNDIMESINRAIRKKRNIMHLPAIILFMSFSSTPKFNPSCISSLSLVITLATFIRNLGFHSFCRSKIEQLFSANCPNNYKS